MTPSLRPDFKLRNKHLGQPDLSILSASDTPQRVLAEPKACSKAHLRKVTEVNVPRHCFVFHVQRRCYVVPDCAVCKSRTQYFLLKDCLSESCLSNIRAWTGIIAGIGRKETAITAADLGEPWGWEWK